MASICKPLYGERRKGRRALVLRSASALFVALLASTSPARADDMFMASGAFDVMGVVFILWIAVTPFVEAGVLQAFLKVGYWRALGYAILANLASALLGALWAGMFAEGGWKMALLAHQWNVLPRLFIRSFVVTTAEEGMVVALLVRQERRIGLVYGAVAVANLVSYLAIAAIYVSSATR